MTARGVGNGSDGCPGNEAAVTLMRRSALAEWGPRSPAWLGPGLPSTPSRCWLYEPCSHNKSRAGRESGAQLSNLRKLSRVCSREVPGGVAMATRRAYASCESCCCCGYICITRVTDQVMQTGHVGIGARLIIILGQRFAASSRVCAQSVVVSLVHDCTTDGSI